MKGWTETWRGIVAPWECDLTEHFTIAYYFDRLADAASAIGASLSLTEASRSSKRRFDVRFVRELRAGTSFHIMSAPIRARRRPRSCWSPDRRLGRRRSHGLGRGDARYRGGTPAARNS